MTREGSGGGEEEVTVVGFRFGKRERRVWWRRRWLGREVVAAEWVVLGMDNGGHGLRQKSEAANITSYVHLVFTLFIFG